ncbi:ATP-binding cassette domain-containing protein [Lacticaseibacillus zhaodongensis]|uniref:ATP-binding cassette domain-containing protein n=1 Tax=Lacticaseibacillus zhaodongensis TaxID=2668065 RepID=UPI0012D36BDF|nr:ABC transporter ATP-binding protein [Lacticaseibacillus zhaodongensis]
MTESEAAVSFKHVSKAFAGGTVISDLNLDIPAHGIFVLVGPSGSGKTTTLKMINGLVVPTGGDVYYAGKRVKDYDLQQLRWRIGYVLQTGALFPNMTVAQNIAVIPEMKHVAPAEIKRTGDELLAAVDLPAADYAARYPSDLSGGEAQRVGIVRALAADPPTILMDEPFSALDPLSRRQLQDLLLSLQAKLHKTIIFVTHDMNEALKMGDHIAIMHEGRIQQVGTPEEIKQSPANQFVADFFAGAGKADPLSAEFEDVVAAGLAARIQELPAAGKFIAGKTALDAGVEQLAAAGQVYVQCADGDYVVTAGAVLQYIARARAQDDNGN